MVDIHFAIAENRRGKKKKEEDNKNSSGDEIANVNFFTTSHM